VASDDRVIGRHEWLIAHALGLGFGGRMAELLCGAGVRSRIRPGSADESRFPDRAISVESGTVTAYGALANRHRGARGHNHCSWERSALTKRSPRPGVAHVALGGEHDLGSANQLQNTLSAVQATCPHLVVDLSPVEFIDSSTIHALLHAKNAATEGGGRFNIVLSTTPLVERVLEITGVLGLLNRVHSLDEALQVS
jgi:anti-anti-sigma factor